MYVYCTFKLKSEFSTINILIVLIFDVRRDIARVHSPSHGGEAMSAMQAGAASDC